MSSISKIPMHELFIKITPIADIPKEIFHLRVFNVLYNWNFIHFV